MISQLFLFLNCLFFLHSLCKISGTLTSVTKLAASWARTLDRLTLNQDDLRLTEEARRLRPQGLTQGLMHGLTEFGISLLGK